MTKLTITDLHASNELDTRAMKSVRGGFSWGYGGDAKHWLGPVSSSIKDLTNINTQLNIAVLSENVFQSNSNAVTQF